jgi:hypothetical protein
LGEYLDAESPRFGGIMVEGKKEPPKGPAPPPFEWTPEMVHEVVAGITAVIKEYGDRYLGLTEKKFDHEIRMATAGAKADWWVLAIFLTFLAFVVGLVVWLTLAGRVSGDALLFLVGTISGYVLVIVQRHLFPESIEVHAPPL